MYYEITRGLRIGKNLTPAQRTSSLFSEEPVVLGRVLRRGSGPIRISPEDFERNKVHLLRLERAGSITITPPQANNISTTESTGLESPESVQAESVAPSPEPKTDETVKAAEVPQTESAVTEEPPTTRLSVEEAEPATTVADEQPRKKRRKE
jgi:hypothetical protein